MNEHDILTFLIVFALIMNFLGFLFFVLSLRNKESTTGRKPPKENKVKHKNIREKKDREKLVYVSSPENIDDSFVAVDEDEEDSYMTKSEPIVRNIENRNREGTHSSSGDNYVEDGYDNNLLKNNEYEYRFEKEEEEEEEEKTEKLSIADELEERFKRMNNNNNNNEDVDIYKNSESSTPTFDNKINNKFYDSEEKPNRFLQELKKNNSESSNQPDYESKFQFRHSESVEESYRPKYEEQEEENTPTNDHNMKEYSKYQFSYEENEYNEIDKSAKKNTSMNTELTEKTNYGNNKYEENTLSDNDKYRFDGEYQFKHAYSKDERKKYEYDENTSNKKHLHDDFEEDIDYDIDVDKEHEKYYGTSSGNSHLEKYEAFLGKEKKEEKARKMFKQEKIIDNVSEEQARELPQVESEQGETFNIKQFEPLKYKNDDDGKEEEFDEAEVDRRIEYLMGRMNDPFKKQGKPDPLDEEF